MFLTICRILEMLSIPEMVVHEELFESFVFWGVFHTDRDRHQYRYCSQNGLKSQFLALCRCSAIYCVGVGGGQRENSIALLIVHRVTCSYIN